MNLILLGPQGSGKGTQARKLCEKFGFYYFESGEFLREAAKKNESLRKMLSEGALVPDREMVSYVTAFLDEKGLYDNILFDGFPRSIVQYQALAAWLKDKRAQIDLALVLEISEKETIKRLSARRIDPKTGQIYNLSTDLPPDNISLDSLIQREDDKPEAIKKRLGWYHDQVRPLIEKLKEDIKVVEVNGERPIAAIQADLVAMVKNNNG
jgi:adenylate kinase